MNNIMENIVKLYVAKWRNIHIYFVYREKSINELKLLETIRKLLEIIML